MNKEILKLENQLCFSVYACSREITRLYRPYLEELGLTYPQYLVLLVLWDKGPSLVRELGDELFLDSGTLTPMLKRMETSGLVTRERSSEDERKVFITLTKKGEALKEKAYCIPETLLQQSGVSPADFSKLLEQSRSLLQNIHQYNEKGD
ncbi:MarR family transcriptional regulator [Ectobacillus sp. JY-23]|uniref:MarR family winged helix-turn-helix transcriptional regulator n=1 Tax=Ectobacillus sp. JY-23 TaxID=2933872 RepID=UPI001FF6BC01|nr:MarR family transcriptional regulator [Ectobacillus sp. JY-23]UOY91216.1 MarR family transcriptional regulator [Ectobacillus sp. JY-23]